MTYTTPLVSIGGIPSAVPTQVEYTNGRLASAYYNAIMAFMELLQIQPTSTNPIPSLSITSANVNDVNSQLALLTKIAKYGILVDASGNAFVLNGPPTSADLAGKTRYYMTMSMAQDYDKIIRSLAAVGVNIDASGNNSPQVTLDQLKLWRDLATQVSSVANAVQAAALTGYAGAKTLQGMIMVDYIQTGNDLITKNLSDLKSALTVTQDVISELTDLQNIHNQITVKTDSFGYPIFAFVPSTFTVTLSIAQGNPNQYYGSIFTGGQGNPIPGGNYPGLDSITGYTVVSSDGLNVTYSVTASYYKQTGTTSSFDYTNNLGVSNDKGGASAWAGIYQRYASAYFNRPLTPSLIDGISPGQANFTSAFQALVKTRDSLMSSFATLSAITSSADKANSNSLYSRVKTVLDDLNANFVTSSGNPITLTTSSTAAAAGFKKWMLDNYSAYANSNVALQGKIQNNITTAVTAAQNLNDQQKETVRNYMYVFEQYYKSASAALQAISQIIQKMAQNIAR
jgi:hypothetical protein